MSKIPTIAEKIEAEGLRFPLSATALNRDPAYLIGYEDACRNAAKIAREGELANDFDLRIMRRLREENPDYCFCPCHYPGDGFAAIHMVACCYPCPDCRDWIKMGHQEKHAPHCGARHLRERLDAILKRHKS